MGKSVVVGPFKIKGKHADRVRSDARRNNVRKRKSAPRSQTRAERGYSPRVQAGRGTGAKASIPGAAPKIPRGKRGPYGNSGKVPLAALRPILAQLAAGKLTVGNPKDAAYLRSVARGRNAEDYADVIAGKTPKHDDKLKEAGTVLNAERKRDVYETKHKDPLVKGLDLLNRPGYAVTAAARAAKEGRDIDSAAGKGLAGKDRGGGRALLKSFGVKNKVALGVGGFATDILTDPLTYVTLGAGKAIATPSQVAAKEFAKETAKGATKQVAIKAAKKALDKAAAKPTSRGLRVGARARVPLTDKVFEKSVQVPGTRRLGHHASKLGHSGPVKGARRTFQHDYREQYHTKRQHETLRAGEGKARAHEALAADEAYITQREINAALRRDLMPSTARRTTARVLHPRKTRRQVSAHGAKLVEQAEKGTVKVTPTEQVEKLRRLADSKSGATTAERKLAAEKADSAMDALTAAEAKRQGLEMVDGKAVHPIIAKLIRRGEGTRQRLNEHGVEVPKFAPRSTDDAQTFTPRYKLHETTKKGAKIKRKRGDEGVEPQPQVRGGHNPQEFQQRTIRSKLADLTGRLKDDPAEAFDTDLGRVWGKYQHDAEKAIGRSEWQKSVLDSGRKVKPGPGQPLREGEAVYAFNKKSPDKGFAELKGDDLARFRAGKGSGDNAYVALHRKSYEASKKRVSNYDEQTRHFKALDQATGFWKGNVTVWSPAFHGRNEIGDLIRAFQGDTNPVNLIRSFRAQKSATSVVRARKSGATLTGGKMGVRRRDVNDVIARAEKRQVNIGPEGKISALDLYERANRHNVIGAGQYGTEIKQLSGGAKFASENKLARASRHREDNARLATFVSQKRRGASDAEAAAYANKVHFDYGDLTDAEKMLRRSVFPFWTWMARNTREQVNQLLTRPGKTAAIMHGLDNIAKAQDYESWNDFVEQLAEYEQRSLPIPFGKKGGERGNPSIPFANVGIPLQDLQLPTDLVLGRFAAVGQNLGSRVNPFVKVPVEVGFNYSTFFRGKIAHPQSPTTKAPKVLESLPPGIRNKLGLVTTSSRQTGKEQTEYSRKVDYALRQLGPWANLLMNMSKGGTDKDTPFPKTKNDALLGLTGVKPSKSYPTRALLNNAYKIKQELTDKSGSFSKRTDVPTERKDAYNKQIKALDEFITAVETDLGYVKPHGAKKAGSGNPLLDDFNKFLEGTKSGSNPILDDFNKSQEKTTIGKAPAKKKSNPLVARANPRPSAAPAPSSSGGGSGGSGGSTTIAVADSPRSRGAKATTATNIPRGAKTYGASTFGGSGDPGTGSTGYRGDNLNDKPDSFAELSNDPQNGTGADFAAMGGLEYGTKVRVTNPKTGKSMILTKRDVGAGGGGVNGHKRAIDIWHVPAKKLGINGLAAVKVEVLTGKHKGKVINQGGTQLAPGVTPVQRTAGQKAAIASYLLNPKKPGALLEMAAALKDDGNATPVGAASAGVASSPSRGTGKVAVAGGANRAGVGLSKALTRFASDMAGYHGGTLKITTGTNHNRNTTSGNVSDHWSGNGADFGLGGDVRSSASVRRKGDRIAYSAFRAAGLSDKRAKSYVKKGGAYTFNKGGKRIQIIYKSDVGGNHYNHVHVGIGS